MNIDFNKLSECQQAALGRVVVRQRPFGHPRTLESLVRNGLLEAVDRTEQGRYGLFQYEDYYMPAHVHIQWCAWCADQWSESHTGS